MQCLIASLRPLIVTAASFALLCAAAPAAHCLTLKFLVGGWMGPTGQDRWCAQLDDDAALEFVVARPGGSEVTIYDGLTGAEDFSYDTGYLYPIDASCTIIDIDADGFDEVLVRMRRADGGSTVVIDTTVPSTAVPSPRPDDERHLDRPSVVLHQNAPNPFNPATEIRFALPVAGTVELRIYDAAGRLARVLSEGRLEAGDHAVRWDGRGDAGQALASGVYYYELVTPGGNETRKAVLLK